MAKAAIATILIVNAIPIVETTIIIIETTISAIANAITAVAYAIILVVNAISLIETAIAFKVIENIRFCRPMMSPVCMIQLNIEKTGMIIQQRFCLFSHHW